MSLLPCHRYFPAGVSFRTNQSSITHAAFAQTLKARPPEFPPFEVTLRSLALRPGSSLTIPRTALSMGFNRFGFPYGCHPSYGSLVPFPAGLAPAEHACLTWTHNVLAASTAAYPSGKSVRRLRGTLRRMIGTHMSWQSEEQLVRNVNRMMHGWMNYFRYGTVWKTYVQMERFLQRRVRDWLVHKHRLGTRGECRYPATYLYETMGLVNPCVFLKLRKPSG
jgi:hypothetical protein